MQVRLFENRLEIIPMFKQSLIMQVIERQIFEEIRFFYIEEDIDRIDFYLKGEVRKINSLFIEVSIKFTESKDIMDDVSKHLSNISMKNKGELDHGLSYMGIQKDILHSLLVGTDGNSKILFWYNFNDKENIEWNGVI